jgi:Sulfotransferase family
MQLTALLVAGYGRSGTTALMQLLGSDPRVLIGRAYPFEDRFLSSTSKLAVLLERNRPQGPAEQLYSFEDCSFSGFPWLPPGPIRDRPEMLSGPEWLNGLWSLLETRIRSHFPGAAYYAEKVAAWVPAFVRRCMPARTLYLFRDPRDMFLSANAFMRQRNYFSFGRGPRDSDLDHARNLAHEFLLYFENYRADKERSDCLLVRYSDLVQALPEMTARLHDFADLNCLIKNDSNDLEFHRTASSPEQSIDRWRREPLPKGVARFLETYLQESMTALRYDFTTSRDSAACPGVDFTRDTEIPPGIRYFSVDDSFQRDENGLAVPFQDGQFRVEIPVDAFSARAIVEIWVSLYGPAIEQVSLSWRSGRREYSERRRLALPAYAAPHWRVFRFPVGCHERWQGKITGLRLELTGQPAPENQEAAYLRWLRLVE